MENENVRQALEEIDGGKLVDYIHDKVEKKKLNW